MQIVPIRYRIKTRGKKKTCISTGITRQGIEFDTGGATLGFEAADLVDQIGHQPDDHGERERVIAGDQAERLVRGRRSLWSRRAVSRIGGRPGAAKGEAAGAAGGRGAVRGHHRKGRAEALGSGPSAGGATATTKLGGASVHR